MRSRLLLACVFVSVCLDGQAVQAQLQGGAPNLGTGTGRNSPERGAKAAACNGLADRYRLNGCDRASYLLYCTTWASDDALDLVSWRKWRSEGTVPDCPR